MPDTPTRILDATLDVASRIGLARLTVEDVARAARVSRQTVYRHFGDRDGLIEATILREEARLLAGMRAAAERHRELRPALESAIAEALRAAREHPLLDRLVASEPEALLPFLLTGRSPVLSAAAPAVRELLATRVPHVTEPALEVVVDAATRLVVSYAVAPPALPPGQLAAGLAELLLEGLKGPA